MKVIMRTGGQDYVINDMPQAPAVGERIKLELGHGDNVYAVTGVRWVIGSNGTLSHVEVDC